MSQEPIVNHEEADQLSNLKREESNLARCYLDLKLQNGALKARLWDIVQAFKRGAGPNHSVCTCQRCVGLGDAVRMVKVYGPDSEIFTEKRVGDNDSIERTT
jgi:hypothetical protein